MKLTEEQRKLVEENHNLIYGFLNMNELDENEYYDIAAFGLCKATNSYDPTKGKFSTYAYKFMKSEIKNLWAYDARKCRVPRKIIYSYNHLYNKEDGDWHDGDLISIECNKSSRDIADIFIEKENISNFLLLLKEDEQLIIKYLVNGFTQKEIANKMNVTKQAIYQRTANIRKKWNEYSEKGYITKKKRGRKKLVNS